MADLDSAARITHQMIHQYWRLHGPVSRVYERFPKNFELITSVYLLFKLECFSEHDMRISGLALRSRFPCYGESPLIYTATHTHGTKYGLSKMARSKVFFAAPCRCSNVHILYINYLSILPSPILLPRSRSRSRHYRCPYSRSQRRASCTQRTSP